MARLSTLMLPLEIDILCLVRQFRGSFEHEHDDEHEHDPLVVAYYQPSIPFPLRVLCASVVNPHRSLGFGVRSSGA
jgi:hypothetical protein